MAPEVRESSLERKWQTLFCAVKSKYPVLANVWLSARQSFGQEWLSHIIENVEKVYGSLDKGLNKNHLSLIDGYAEFCNDSLRHQVFFEKFGRYKNTNYQEATRAFYHNAVHMNERYLPGMFISHFIWPQHHYMLENFKNQILPRVGKFQTFFEVGVGCGVYSNTILSDVPECNGVGFDISQHALDYTEIVIQKNGFGHRYKTKNHDISIEYKNKCDFLVCQEVLEHLENPSEFCSWLARMISPGGNAYVTAALNAGHSDHIYLFSEPAQLEEMLRQAGFQPISLFEEFAFGKKQRAKTPSLCGFLCRV
jgi:2-polyprenyl-3-methyl-5-hydroxy-6-metoxy-1,4-benzoquinol methylase